MAFHYLRQLEKQKRSRQRRPVKRREDGRRANHRVRRRPRDPQHLAQIPRWSTDPQDRGHWIQHPAQMGETRGSRRAQGVQPSLRRGRNGQRTGRGRHRQQRTVSRTLKELNRPQQPLGSKQVNSSTEKLGA